MPSKTLVRGTSEPERSSDTEGLQFSTIQYVYTNIRPVNYIDDCIHVEFDVETARDALIRFSGKENPSKDDPVYEIVLGGSTNTRLYVRRLQQRKTVKSEDIRGLLSACSARGFWIQISRSGKIMVGKRGLTAPHVLTVWEDPDPLDIKYISFSSYYGVWATWYHYKEVRKAREYGCISTVADYKYEKFKDVNYKNTYAGDEIFIEFSVKTLRDGHLLLTPEKFPKTGDPVYELVLGGNTNTSLFLRRFMGGPNAISMQIKDLVGDEWKDYWIRVKKTGEIEVGKQSSEEKIVVWKDRQPLNIRYLSFSGWTGADGLWTYNYEGCSDLQSLEFNTEEYEYTNVRPVKYIDDCIHVEFDVQTARDAFIRFSCKENPSADDPIYEIVLGGSTNTYLYVRRLPKRNMVKCEEIRDLLSACSPRGFWIQISRRGKIIVGQRDLTAPHVLTVWEDPDPLDIKYIGFSSNYGVWATWYHYKIEVPNSRDYGCISTNDCYKYEKFVDVNYKNTSEGEQIFVEFSVKTLRDGHLLLTPEKYAKSGDPVYEFVFGGDTNSSFLFRLSMGGPTAISVYNTNYLAGNEWKDYWIRVKKTGEIEVGKQFCEEKFVVWKDPQPLNIRYLSFSGWTGVYGLWTYKYGGSICK